jgi:hypothetical protein
MAGHVKPIIIKDSENKREYTLEFDRDSVRFAEGRGFKLEDVDTYSMTKVPEFFWYAFRMHHKNVALNQAEEILRQIGGMNEQIARRLVELWVQTYESLGNEETKNPAMSVEL